jgi:ATP-dependent Clp protease ATP-binding subunit ClpC
LQGSPKIPEDPLAEEILSMNIKNGDVLIAELDKENSKISFFERRTKRKIRSLPPI